MSYKNPDPEPLVLIVDDFEDTRELYAEYLGFFGFRFETAASGLEAMERADELLPSVILLDLVMPRIDGWAVLRHLKSNPRTRRIPVIVVTAHSLPRNEERAMACGASNVITKPAYPHELVMEILRVLDGQ